MSEAKYNTNLAAEFYVLSMLHRLGADANLTLGNKKAVDIAVVKAAGRSLTVDVKGLAGKTAFPVDNFQEGRKGHYLAFVCFGGRIEDPGFLPEVWIVPSLALAPLIYVSPSGRRVVPRNTLRNKAARYQDAWLLLTGTVKE